MTIREDKNARRQRIESRLGFYSMAARPIYTLSKPDFLNDKQYQGDYD